MNDALEKALMRKLEGMFADTGDFLRVLADDYRFSRHILEKDPKNQIYRRMAVRNFCAEVEGMIHAFKWAVLLCYQAFGVRVTSAEIAALREESCDLDSGGNATPKSQHFAFAQNFKFGCNMFARVFQCSYSVDYRSDGWVCVKQAFDVRNRLMHPKMSKGLEVSDAEVLVLKKASSWLQGVSQRLLDTSDIAKVVARAKSNRARELN
jgi:hypothetical protein